VSSTRARPPVRLADTTRSASADARSHRQDREDRRRRVLRRNPLGRVPEGQGPPLPHRRLRHRPHQQQGARRPTPHALLADLATQLLADDFAANGFKVVAPDYLHGDPIPVEAMEAGVRPSSFSPISSAHISTRPSTSASGSGKTTGLRARARSSTRSSRRSRPRAQPHLVRRVTASAAATPSTWRWRTSRRRS
jgi:hypothetical protein